MATRRKFLQNSLASGFGSSLLSFPLLARRNFAQAPASGTDGRVEFPQEIERIVRILEETPRDQAIERMAQLSRDKLSYRDFVAALFLAGIRNVNPQPPGFKFHCVFVIHSAVQLSMHLPPKEALLPLLWAVDQFKDSQQQDVEQGDFQLLTPKRVAEPSSAREEFRQAMDSWDEARADAAIVGLYRSCGAHDVMEELWRYGSRDYRNIGHKAIFVANSWRTLQLIGWELGENVLRSLVLGLLHFGKDQSVNGFAFADQTYLHNLELVRQMMSKLPADCWTAPANRDESIALLHGLREASPADACTELMTRLLPGHLNCQSAWDALHLMAGELMMRKPGIYGIHTVTSINALHYACRSAFAPETRLLMLLQACGWMTQFRTFMQSSTGDMLDTSITDLRLHQLLDEGQGATSADALFDLSPDDLPSAAKHAHRLAANSDQVQRFLDLSRGLLVRKGDDAHDYKYFAAISEDLDLVSPNWRGEMLAAATYYLPRNGTADSAAATRARTALLGSA